MKEISHHHKSGECPVCGILFAHIHYKGDKPKDFVRECLECSVIGSGACSEHCFEPSLEQIAIQIATEKTAGWEIKLENLIQRVREDERNK